MKKFRGLWVGGGRVWGSGFKNLRLQGLESGVRDSIRV